MTGATTLPRHATVTLQIYDGRILTVGLFRHNRGDPNVYTTTFSVVVGPQRNVISKRQDVTVLSVNAGHQSADPTFYGWDWDTELGEWIYTERLDYTLR